MNLETAILFLREIHSGVKADQIILNARETNCTVRVVNFDIHAVDNPVAMATREVAARLKLNFSAGFNYLEVW